MSLYLKMKISEILKEYPIVYEVFLMNGFKSKSMEDLIEQIGSDVMLQTVLKVRNINTELFLNQINERIETEEEEYIIYNPELPKNIAAQTTYPTERSFIDRITDILKNHENETGEKVNCYMVDSRGPKVEYQGFSDHSIHELPDIIMSKGFDEVYGKKFIDKFIDKEYFESAIYGYGNVYEDKNYTLNTAMLKVMLMDKVKLGNLPMPEKWSDLLKPIYKDKIIAFGNEREVSKTTLIYLYKDFGIDGVKKYAENVKSLCLGPKMVKLAGTNSEEGAAIYILPSTFAMMSVREGTEIVWPTDGANLVPLSILIKKANKEKMKFFIDFLLEDYGQMYEDIDSVSFNPDIESKLLKEKKIKWVGWDYIYSNDLFELGNQLKKEFHKVYDNKVKGV